MVTAEKENRDGDAATKSVFQQAVKQYINEVANKKNSKKHDFIVGIVVLDPPPTGDEVQKSVDKLQSKFSSEARRKKTARVIKPLVQGFQDYYAIIDTLVQAYPMPLALIWGGLKAIIDLGARFINLIDTISEELKQLTEQLNRLVDLEDLYREFPSVQRLLCASYVNILRFLCEVNKQCRKGAFHQLVSSSFTNTKILKIVGDLKANADQVDRVAVIAENQLNAGSRQEVRTEAVKAECERIAAQQERKTQENWRREDSSHKDRIVRNELKSWLHSDNAINIGLYKKLLRLRHESSGTWLLNHHTFKSWLDGTLHPHAIRLHATPGAGKSVLCAFAIEQLRTSFKKTAVFVFAEKYLSDAQNLRNLGYQLLLHYYETGTGLPHELSSFLDKDYNDSSHIKELISFLVKELKEVYIFIDGVDEAPHQFIETLAFVKQLASDPSQGIQVRLWVSSQDTAVVRDLLKDLHELDSCPYHLKRDITSYLSAAMPILTAEGNPDSINKVQEIVREKAEHNFLWAAQMIELLKEADSEGQRMMIALEGLPKTVEEYYYRILERLRKEDTSQNNLVSLMLSIVAFSRRPLTLPELQEAIATSRSRDNQNLDRNHLPFPQKLLKKCAPLVEFIATPDEPSDGVFRLTHSVVYSFLENQASIRQEPSGEHAVGTILQSQQQVSFISIATIAECSLRYLSQPKYSKLLDKKFIDTCDQEDFKGHHFLKYASKFWIKHFHRVTPSKEYCEKIRTFLESANFQTSIQIQASFILGHFIQSHDSSSGRGRFTRKFLPDWLLTDCEDFKRMQLDYLAFIDEWSELLQKGIGTPFRSEIDRCFWGALGPKNFLHANSERYTSFMFCNGEATKGSLYPVCSEAIISDQSQLKVFRIASDDSNHLLNIQTQLWNVQGNQPPSCVQISNQDLPTKDRFSNLYSSSFGRKFSIVPGASSQYRPSFVEVSEDLQILRIGSMLLRYQTDDQSSLLAAVPEVEGISSSYWEEIAARGVYIALARRRKPREKAFTTKQLAKSLGRLSSAMKRDKVRRDSSADGSAYDTDIEEDSASSIASFSDLEESDVSSDEIAGNISSPEEAWSDSEISDDSNNSKSPGLSSDAVDIEFDSNIESDDFNSDLESVASADDLSIHSATSDSPKWLPRIRGGDSSSDESNVPRFDCDVCKEDIHSTHYHCNWCHQGRFDICGTCLEAGKWCLNTKHQLLHRQNNCEILDIISVDNLSLGQDLVILQQKEDTLAVVFHWPSSRVQHSNHLIYDSPPLFHPSSNLVVWPTGEGLLFADFAKNSFFEEKLYCSNKKACHVSVQLSFSTCGKYLHALSLEATKPVVSRHEKKSGFKPLLSVHISTFQLSSSKISTSPPKTIFRTSINLGRCNSTFVSQIPVGVTWSGSAAYVTISYHQLVLYKVNLFPDAENPSSRNVFVPRNPIFLPRSARDRRMRFIPAASRGTQEAESEKHQDGKALLIIEGCNGGSHTRPLGVYLSEGEHGALGGWIALSKSLRMTDDLKTKQKLEGKFEFFDAEEDCDLMPFQLRTKG